MKCALSLILSLICFQFFAGAAVAGIIQNATDSATMLQNGYVRIWAEALKPGYKAEMECEIKKHNMTAQAIEQYKEEVKKGLEIEVAHMMKEMLLDSCSGFRSFMERELSEMFYTYV